MSFKEVRVSRDDLVYPAHKRQLCEVYWYGEKL